MTKKRIDYDVWEFTNDTNKAFDLAILTARELGVLRNRGYHVSMDGTHLPFYGEGHDYGPDARRVDESELSIAARWAAGGFRKNSAGTSSVPIYAGTKNIHHYFGANIHILDTLESLPLRVHRGRANSDRLDDFMAAIDALPEKPMFWFGDKEFATEAYTHRLAPWCHRNQVILMIPSPKRAPIRKRIVDNWQNGTAKPVWNNGKTMYWWAEPYRFNEKNHHKKGDMKLGQPLTMLTVYFEGEAGEDEQHGPDVVISLGDNLYAVCFLVNVEVTQENVVWLQEQYKGRWSTENVWKRAKAYTGASFSSGMFGRHLAYVGGMLSLSAYALWRMHRRIQRNLAVHDPSLSHVRFFEALGRQCEKELLGLAPPPTAIESVPFPSGPFEAPRKTRRAPVVAQSQSEAIVASYA